MSFYQSIAPYYHHIFKINAAQLNYIKSKISDPNSQLIDVGCGIGTLSFELAKYYGNVVGIDLDAEMIRVAQQQNGTNKVQFRQFGMLELSAHLENKSVDGIICFGNTLVHLNSNDEVFEFLLQAKSVLKFNGKLLMQMVNYDRILNCEIKQLPLIENDEILFERNYLYKKSLNKIDFHTRLTVKSTQQIIESSVELLPILQSELNELLVKAGFKNLKYYGNFNQESYTMDSPALVVEAW